ncbi:hypothetical protein Clacol_003421 [Clathrus columnatus]|uniref:Uncharacterized protein n=1 Tax=Clathrus columnatus TaxID=1419009 RepID=A0AAV5A7H5_9AGAM|nr:hypothetical protein Clacol_003421 [Clathrus columnatus]
MSLVLLIIWLHSLVGAVPLTITDEPRTSSAGVATRNVVQANINSQRSTLDILWSCLATTFAVTWLSIHPNILSPGEKVWWIIWRRFKLMFWALVAPEFVILWAWRQRRAAHRIAEEVRILAKKRNQTYGHDWTVVHGHFLQMGGFFIQLGNRSPRVLYFEQFQSMVGKTIDIPQISVDEINDRGKNDPLGKGVAALQIIWFIVQIIARRTNHLAITQLELTTSALACLNATMYILWWSKPLDVRCPVIIRPYQVAGQSIQSPNPVICRDSTSHQETLTETTLIVGDDKLTTVPSAAQVTDNICSPEKHQVPCIMKDIISLIAEPFLDIAHTVSGNLKDAFTHGIISGLKSCLFGWLIAPFIHLVVGIVIERHMNPGDRTPIFYVWPGGSDGRSCNTQTTSEMSTWTVRTSNLFRTRSSSLSSDDTIARSIEALHSQLIVRATTRWGELLMASLIGGLFGGAHILVIARILLFINSLLALRALPSSAFATLNWLSIIPHI